MNGQGADGRGVAARRAALRAIRRVHDGGAWSAPAVDAELRGGGLDARDRAFAASLAYETLRWEGTLDWALERVSSRPLARLDAAVLDVLRLGCWQLLRGRMPARAAVGSTVEVARAEVGAHVTGFVNGVLRALDRQRDELPWPSEDSDRGLGLALGYPGWVVAEARRRFGDRARSVLEAGNAAPGVTLRARPGERDGLIAELRAEGLKAEPGKHSPQAVRVPGADPGRLAAVAEGRALVQDEASMLVAHATIPVTQQEPPSADPLAARRRESFVSADGLIGEPPSADPLAARRRESFVSADGLIGEARSADRLMARRRESFVSADGLIGEARSADRLMARRRESFVSADGLIGEARSADPLILDACAGPGGKATHLVELGGTVVATDLRPQRARLVAEHGQRLGLGSDRLRVLAADATQPPFPQARFDAVLVDAPCTGLGVVRRRPELRWRLDPGDPEHLAALQLRLLDASAGLLRTGGRLVYSVCTWTEVETTGVVRRLLAVAGDRLTPVDVGVETSCRARAATDEPGIQLSPDRDDTDGMFLIAFRRR